MTAPQTKTQHELLQERATTVDLRAYHLHLDLSEVLDSPTYRVTTRLELSSSEPELFLDYLGESVAEVKVEVIGAQVHRRCAFLEQLVLRLILWCGHVYAL